MTTGRINQIAIHRRKIAAPFETADLLSRYFLRFVHLSPHYTAKLEHICSSNIAGALFNFICGISLSGMLPKASVDSRFLLQTVHLVYKYNPKPFIFLTK